MPGAADLSALARLFAQEVDAEVLEEFDRTDGRFDGPNSQALLDRPFGSRNSDLFEDEIMREAGDDRYEVEDDSVQAQLEADGEFARMLQRQDDEAAELEDLMRRYSALGSLSFGSSVPDVASSADLLSKFAKGAIRITRTPNRQRLNTPNTIRLDEICRKEALQSMWLSTFLLAQAEVFPFLPFKDSGPHALRDAPVYISREINSDGMRKVLAEQLGQKKVKDKVTQKELSTLGPVLAGMYKNLYGTNCRMIYPWTSGICHSKAMVIEYRDCLVVCITSSNMMNCDLVFGDNAYFIQAFPRLRFGQQPLENDFASRLFDHMEALGASEFVDRVRGKFDFSAARVHLFSCEPGTKKGRRLEEFGVLSLAKLVRELVPSQEQRKQLRVEVCAGSVGVLKPAWIAQTLHFLTGGDPLRSFPSLENPSAPQPSTRLKIIYPSVDTVKRCDPDAIQAASNIGCSLNGEEYAGWLAAPSWIRDYFHEYVSTDSGRLFHLKQIIWLAPSTSASSPPPLIAFGSANFSEAALGVVKRLQNGEATIAMKNFELGVVVKGKDWVEMLEKGSQWEDGITYKRSAPRYAQGARPWNSPAWARKGEQ